MLNHRAKLGRAGLLKLLVINLAALGSTGEQFHLPPSLPLVVTRHCCLLPGLALSTCQESLPLPAEEAEAGSDHRAGASGRAGGLLPTARFLLQRPPVAAAFLRILLDGKLAWGVNWGIFQ